MTLNEYLQVQNYDYLEYCDYLQNKYGLPICDYMTKAWNKSKRISRTKDGLYAHHKYEDHAILLSDPAHAIKNPYEWQLRENIVYCDLLEHLFLHILICENPSKDKNSKEDVGIGGILSYIVPELNDVYSGWVSKQSWQINCHNAIIDDKDVYMALLKRFKTLYRNNPFFIKSLYHSWNERFGIWSNKNNQRLYEEIARL